MKARLALAVAFFCSLATSAFAQQHAFSDLPPCALNCSLTYTPWTGCATDDMRCICTHRTWRDFYSQCMFDTCNAEDWRVSRGMTTSRCNDRVRDRTGLLIGVAITFSVIVLAACVVRFLHHVPFTSQFGWDDAFILLALAGTLAMAVTYCLMTRIGVGKDSWKVSLDDIDETHKYFYINEILYVWITGMTKLSVLFFYLRTFPWHFFHRVIYITIIACICYTIAFTFATIFQCKPLSVAFIYWREGSDKCFDVNTMMSALSGVNIALYFMIMLLPVPYLITLETTFRRYSYIATMFCLITTAAVFGMIRFHMSKDLVYRKNFTFEYAPPAAWTKAEVDICMLCACLPAIYLFFTISLPTRLGRVPASTTNSRALSHIYLKSDGSVYPLPVPLTGGPRRGSGPKLVNVSQPSKFSRKASLTGGSVSVKTSTSTSTSTRMSDEFEDVEMQRIYDRPRIASLPEDDRVEVYGDIDHSRSPSRRTLP